MGWWESSPTLRAVVEDVPGRAAEWEAGQVGFDQLAARWAGSDVPWRVRFPDVSLGRVQAEGRTGPYVTSISGATALGVRENLYALPESEWESSRGGERVGCEPEYPRLVRIHGGNMVKTILVGHGYFGRIYREHLDTHPNFNVVGVCDTDYERLRMLTSTTTAPSYDFIRDNVEHDAVIICTPPSDHADITIKALAAGKSVLCMKPGAMSMTEADMVEKAALDTDSFYVIDYTAAYSPEYRDLVPSLYGTTTSLSSSRHVAGGPKPEGIILDLLSHDVAMFDDVFWDVSDVSVSCQMLNAVTAALTITNAEGERLMYANASYNATYPTKEMMLRVKPRNDLANPLITTTWVQNHRYIKVESQGRSIELHYRHEPDPITRSLDNFYEGVAHGGWSNHEIYRSIWKILHAAMHSAENDGILVKVSR